MDGQEKKEILALREKIKLERDTKVFIGDRARPTMQEIDNAIEAIQIIKSSIVRGQDYENAAKVRDAERLFVDMKYLHPEQCMDEKFLSNIKEEEVKDFLKYELPERALRARRGRVAYEFKEDANKHYTHDIVSKIEGYRPVFITLKY
jgi:hypothetical protein